MNKRISQNSRHIIIWSFLILAFLVYGLIVYLDRRDTQQSSESTEEEFLDISYVNEETNLLVDSDGDGVYDWEEGLWDELDPNNPDSDGDGISDAEYIAQKKREYTQDLYERAGIEPLSETERFGRSIYTAIYAATQNGEDLDPEDREQISDNIQKYIGTIPLSGKQYLREDLNLTSNSESSVRAYEQAVRDFFDRYEVTLEDAELIFTSIEDPSSFRAQIGERTRYYEEMLGNLLEFEVPLVIAHRHVDLVNAIAQMYGAFNNLNSQEFDEVIAISSVSQLEQITQNLLEAQMYIYRFFDIANEPDTFAS